MRRKGNKTSLWRVKNMEKITFVTAFFDIGRKNWKENKFVRSNEKYLNLFKQWAPEFGNDLFVYTDVEEWVELIRDLRKENHAKTEVIYIKDRQSLCPALYASISNINIEKMQSYRLLPQNPEVINYDYNYVMMLKHVLVLKAIEDYTIVGNAGWIDFGVSHVAGSDTALYREALTNTKNAVTLFSGSSKQELEKCVVFDSICKMESYIYGTLFFGPVDKIKEFSNDCIEAQYLFNRLGLMDDDQMTMYMAWRKKPENYNVINCEWQNMLRICRGMECIENSTASSGKIHKILRNIKRRLIKEKSVIRFRKNLLSFDWPQ